MTGQIKSFYAGTPDVGGRVIVNPTDFGRLGGPPPGVTGLIGWWDASVTASLTLSGSNITGVADQSGAGNDLATAASFPTYNATGFNSKPAMMFSNSVLGHDNFAFGTGNTLTTFFVGQFTNSSASYGRAISYTANGGGNNDANNNGSWLVSRESTTAFLVLYRNGSIAHEAAAASANHRCIATIDSSGVMTIYVDGVAATGNTLNAVFGSPGQLVLGNLLSGSASGWDGSLAEVGVATGFSNSTAVGLLDTYLKTKWGL